MQGNSKIRIKAVCILIFKKSSSFLYTNKKNLTKKEMKGIREKQKQKKLIHNIFKGTWE